MQTAIQQHSAPPLDLGRLHPVDEAPHPEPRPMPVPDRAARDIAHARGRELFCAEITAQRLRAGLTLDALSAATKINASLFAQLERGDLSHWPRGIYRRAFFREYAAAIGLECDESMGRFLELFPESASPPSLTALHGATRHALRLTLAPEPAAGPLVRPALLAAAGIDLGLIATGATLFSVLFGLPPAQPFAVVGVAYSVLGTALLGRSPAAWWLARGAQRQKDRDIRQALRAVVPAPRQD